MALVAGEAGAARLLVERDAFLPALLALLQPDAPAPCLDNAAALLLVLIRDCKLSKPLLLAHGVPALVRVLRAHRRPAVTALTVQGLAGVLTLLAMSKTMLEAFLAAGGLPLISELLAYAPHAAELAAQPDAIPVRRLAADASLLCAATACSVCSHGCLTSTTRQSLCHKMLILSPDSCGVCGQVAPLASAHRACVQGIVDTIHEAACVLVSCLCDLPSRARAPLAAATDLVPRLVDLLLAPSDADIATAAATETSCDGSADANAGAQARQYSL